MRVKSEYILNHFYTFVQAYETGEIWNQNKNMIVREFKLHTFITCKNNFSSITLYRY